MGMEGQLRFLFYYILYVRTPLSPAYLQLGLVPVIERLLPHHAMVVELNPAGEVVRSFHDQGGDVTTSVSHVLDMGDKLLIGSYHAPFLLLLNLSDIKQQ